jgi:hypothetical protein
MRACIKYFPACRAQDRRDPTPPPRNFSSLLRFYSSSCRNPAQERRDPTPPPRYFRCRFFFLSPFRICLWIEMGVCLQQVCCCRVPASPRSVAAARLRLQGLLCRRALASPRSAALVRVSRSFASAFFTFLPVFQVCCRFVSEPQFFQSPRGPWGGL